ncbi:uncharacterized protein [Maniola hyperantus]|uniref:uncharacterized protein n=1 Tax=Aphantopus hyperantus TaxID=2795564 RepID=UPI0015688FD3|nr:uncharacterized protein LOC117994609 [Maniola hyperantus]
MVNQTKNNLDKYSTIKASKEGHFLRVSTNTSNITTTTTGRTPQIDIAKLLAIISDLAMDLESNLTRKLNESMETMNIPTCTTPTPPTTTQQTTVTDEYDANYTGAIIAKCFVCGLDIPGIPQHAHCADAFAGDFLPLVPVDTSAKGKISRYRKYCKYANIRGYSTKESQPRVIIGRWTGGCSVRWVDLSGVYTQRACRNRMQPTMGLHFASKRMAKLEKALWNIENGCIISPVATLTPLSRGVSLYARFHACVCSGNWCNSAGVDAPYYWILFTAVIAIVVFGVT